MIDKAIAVNEIQQNQYEFAKFLIDMKQTKYQPYVDSFYQNYGGWQWFQTEKIAVNRDWLDELKQELLNKRITIVKANNEIKARFEELRKMHDPIKRQLELQTLQADIEKCKQDTAELGELQTVHERELQKLQKDVKKLSTLEIQMQEEFASSLDQVKTEFQSLRKRVLANKRELKKKQLASRRAGPADLLSLNVAGIKNQQRGQSHLARAVPARMAQPQAKGPVYIQGVQSFVAAQSGVNLTQIKMS